MQKTAIIIGAGPAGLTAAYRLLQETDFHPVVLEESALIGGISRTENHGGNRIDIGGHRFFTKNPEVARLWEEILPAEGGLFLTRRRVSRIYFGGRFFDYPISLSLRTVRNLGFLRTLYAGAGYLWSACFKRRERSLREFMINRFGAPLYRMFFEDYTEKVWGRNPRDIAADWGAQRIRGLSLGKAVRAWFADVFSSDSKRPVETSLIGSFRYPKFGPGQMWESLAGKIREMGGEIRTGCRVEALHCTDGRITGVTYRQDGALHTLEGDCVFSSMPVCDLVAGLDCEVPEPVRSAALSLPYRDFITVGLLVSRLRIQAGNGGLVPDCWIYIQDRSVRLGRLQIFNNWSPYMVRDPEDSVWLGLEYFCEEGDGMWAMPDGDFIDFAAAELASIGIIDRADVLDSVRINVKKAYPAYFGSYSRFPAVQEYLDAVENLYCIGRNGQHRYNNMDHSMLTAMEAVRALRGKTDKRAVWTVNADQEYHEES